MLQLSKFDKQINDDCTFIEVILNYNNCYFCYDSSSLAAMEKKDWINLITIEGYRLDLSDSYGSHCDNGDVSIRNLDNKFLVFHIDTATGGSIRFDIPIDNCKDAITNLAEKFD